MPPARTRQPKNAHYCLSKTATPVTGLPVGSVPEQVPVSVLPSLETTAVSVPSTLPAFLAVPLIAWLSKRW